MFYSQATHPSTHFQSARQPQSTQNRSECSDLDILLDENNYLTKGQTSQETYEST